jgi:hypothetical protein
MSGRSFIDSAFFQKKKKVLAGGATREADALTTSPPPPEPALPCPPLMAARDLKWVV